MIVLKELLAVDSTFGVRISLTSPSGWGREVPHCQNRHGFSKDEFRAFRRKRSETDVRTPQASYLRFRQYVPERLVEFFGILFDPTRP